MCVFVSEGDTGIKEESRQDSDYSDDFEESDDENYSDEFETEAAEISDSSKTPISPDLVNTGENGDYRHTITPDCHVTGDDDYPDDFEADSETEEVLGEILSNARAAQDAEAVDDVILDHASPPLSRREKLKQHMIGAFGVKVFEEVQKVNDRKNQEMDRVEFEKLTGSEMMETCYLVNELFIDDTTH